MHLFKKPARWATAAACGLLAFAALPASLASAAGAGAKGGAPAVPARYAQQRLDWQPCQSGALECASMTVPRDWYHPGTGADLTVAVSRHRAADPPRGGAC